jgi:hypothetical protein
MMLMSFLGGVGAGILITLAVGLIAVMGTPGPQGPGTCGCGNDQVMNLHVQKGSGRCVLEAPRK